MGALFIIGDRRGHEATPNYSLAALMSVGFVKSEVTGPALLLSGQAQMAGMIN